MHHARAILSAMSKPAIDIDKLSLEERLELIEQLWESLSQDQRESIPISDDQREELDHRLDLLEEQGPEGVSPEELMERIKRRSS